MAWTQKLNYPVVLMYGCGFTAADRGFVSGGITAGNVKVDDVREFNPDDNTWTQKADYPYGARYWQASFGIGDYGYVGTGLNAAGAPTSSFAQYDPANNQWNTKAAYGGGTTYAQCGFGLNNGKGYLVGGPGKDTTYEYNPDDNTWTQKADFPENRYAAVGFPSTYNGYGYVASGFDGASTKSDCWEYKPGDNSWTQKASLSGKRRSATGFGIGSAGHVIGGTDVFQTSSHQKYESQDNTWSASDVYAHAVDRAAGFSILDKGYTGMGDQTGTLKQDFYEWCCGVITFALDGTVTDEWGNKLRDVSVDLENSNTYNLTTDENGEYSEDVFPDTYTFTVSKPPYITHTEDITISAAVTQDFILESIKAVGMKRLARLSKGASIPGGMNCGAVSKSKKF